MTSENPSIRTTEGTKTSDFRKQFISRRDASYSPTHCFFLLYPFKEGKEPGTSKRQHIRDIKAKRFFTMIGKLLFFLCHYRSTDRGESYPFLPFSFNCFAAGLWKTIKIFADMSGVFLWLGLGLLNGVCVHKRRTTAARRDMISIFLNVFMGLLSCWAVICSLM